MKAWILFALVLAGASAALVPQGKLRGFDVDAFMQMPVLEGGRVKPLDSVARNSLLMIRGKQSIGSESADEWLLDVLFRTGTANTKKIFVINDPEVLGLIGQKQETDRYYTFATLIPYLGTIEQQANAAQQIDSKQRTRFQAAIVNLYERLLLYDRLQNTIHLVRGEDPQLLEDLAAFRPLPAGDTFVSVGTVVRTKTANPALAPLMMAGQAWTDQDAKGFNESTAELLATYPQEARQQAFHEQLFNRTEPFYLGMILYVLALVAVFVSWLWKPQLFRQASFAILGAGAVVHTAGLVARVILQGRPPVTNLYSSAIFVGWAAVLVGMILERLFRRGFGTAVAAASGFVSLIIAHHLMGDGDTMEMMRAVLDSNLWLATHVVTITIGYSGTFLAGAIAIAWTIRRQFAKELDAETSKVLVSMTYGTICFALFFSFIGTVLGGIWADQSWGRFWGWDPKENGALLIVLWNAIILHARWGGYARERGIMAMAIFGNVITSLSWFGVNMLGVGLHSYGFMEGAFVALFSFIASQLALMGLSLLPPHFWRVRQANRAEAHS